MRRLLLTLGTVAFVVVAAPALRAAPMPLETPLEGLAQSLPDEGMAYARKLLAGGVQVTAQLNLGVVHGSALIFRKLLPEVHNKAIRDIVGFAKSL